MLIRNELPFFQSLEQQFRRGLRAVAAACGSTLVDLRDARHIDTASGYGAWPAIAE